MRKASKLIIHQSTEFIWIPETSVLGHAPDIPSPGLKSSILNSDENK